MNIFQDFEYEIKKEITQTGEGEPARTYVVLHNYIGNATKVTVPSEIQGLPVLLLHNTFPKRTEMEEIILPNALERISFGCFSRCERLKKIHLPASMRYIGASAFEDCHSLEELTIEEGGNDISEWVLEMSVFSYCPKLYDEDGFILIRSHLLGYYGTETEVTIPDHITSIADYAFFRTKNLKTLNIPDTVTSIGVCAFQNCKDLEKINLPTGLTMLKGATFKGCTSLERIVFPENLTYIGHYTFSECSNLKEIHWGSALQTICGEAFLKCTSLEVLTFPEGLEEIKVSSFARCSNLKEIHIPASLTMMREKSFDHCDNLETILFAPREKWIHPQENRYPYTPKMRARFIEEGVELSPQVVLGFSKSEEWNYRLDQLAQWNRLGEDAKNLFRVEWKKKLSPNMKKGQNLLRNMVFLDGTAQEMSVYFNEGFHVELPELDHYLDYSIQEGNATETALLLDYKHKTYSKEYLEALKMRKEMLDMGLVLPTLNELCETWHVTVKKDFIKITGYQGEKNTELLPESTETGLPVTVLGRRRGSHKSKKLDYGNLNKICLPEGIIEIEDSAFSFTYLREINFPSTLKKIGEKAFLMTELKEVIMLDGPTVLEGYAFMQCMHLAKVRLANSIREIKDSTFCNCVNLVELKLPSHLEVIEENAFHGCHSLKEINVPKTLKKVEDRAFCYCNELKKITLEGDTVEFHPSALEGCDALEFIGMDGGENLLHKFKKP